MARRRIADEPTSRLAIWARRCAFFSLTATILSIIIVRSGILELEPALATFGAALLFAVLGIVLAFGAFIVVWKDGSDGVGYAFAAIGIGVVLLAYPAYLGYRAYRLPMINDITTDPIDPPRFDVLARLRPRDTVAYAGLYVAEQQKRAYPDIEPLSVSAPPKTAYDAAMGIITKRKWRVVVDRPPQPGRRDGVIEAVARTPIMGFREDIAVRIVPDGPGARIDLRSSSRNVPHDLGSNAARITRLVEDINEITENIKPVQKKQPAPVKGAAQVKGNQTKR
jgi:uncharacterized protein (DUF1499 family)